MSKMILNITATLFSALMLWNCVEDESTVGESTVNNDNTYSPLTVKAAMNDQQQKVISYFYEGANQTTGMAYNGSTSKTTLTTGATGMGIMNLVIGVERGWISREDSPLPENSRPFCRSLGALVQTRRQNPPLRKPK